MGWEIAEGPEVESEWFNFDALNFKPDHPAREMQDTFFVEPPEAHLLMRTHTSPVQVRSMLERELPIYVLCPGKVFRTDELDATHTPVFHQFEGLAIDKKPEHGGPPRHPGALRTPDVRRRKPRSGCAPTTSRSPSRPPSWTSGTRAPRAAPAGSNGAAAAWSTPTSCAPPASTRTIYSGFAFGMGIERTLMFRNEVGDMRDMIEGDVRFSEHFGMEI